MDARIANKANSFKLNQNRANGIDRRVLFYAYMDAAKIVGLKIKRLRQSKEWSQTDLGDKVGLSQVYISKIERGDADPDTELMVKFSEAFDVQIAELFGDIPRTGAVQSAGTAGRGEGRHRVRLNESIESFGNVRYPIVSHIRAGNGTIDKYRVESDDSMEGPSDPRYKGALFFEVKGQSMEPRWEEGD